ncbi:MAG: hypothetical protein COW01_02720 [Bdellovibrionales bacterium CG12_big_fil_rev_8_21_14_0_65_38_15]|nr:MAG: hypothetical protein COW79_08385 [Bdellovibrionales bacterium CG22_combo_CG10-13_8_21_14_all_38_13]PIQ57006.1 MAG: hypothetical protein COW01_02720 [Bdellovibrionales bacterium CG12_big_fil_rev_8_21_14_0_65_38_15]PIR29033.1 MAG: hypothetical protein COV38_12400 [Bdellovibrionales bacterium CG11_big_fil_rev_8_21_14_0_20_38_13]
MTRENWENLKETLSPEKKYYIHAALFGISAGILSLVIPLSAQALINSVTFLIVKWPLGVLTVLLFCLLFFSGLFYILQQIVTEKFQQRFYTRISSSIGFKLNNIDTTQVKDKNIVELINRYFDVMTIQKSVVIILTQGFTLALQTISGLTLLAFYHPYFIVFDLMLIMLIVALIKFSLTPSVNSAINESKAKYATVKWFEEVARVPTFFSKQSSAIQCLNKTDDLISKYIQKREYHFRHLVWQKFYLIISCALMASILMGLGGYLVMLGELSLGQLVAAELIATVILVGISRSSKYLESFYDMIAAIEKIKELDQIPQKIASVELIETEPFESLHLNNIVHKTNNNTFNFNFDFSAGQTYHILTKTLSGKQIFLDMLKGYLVPSRGNIIINKKGDRIIYDNYFKEKAYIYLEPIFIEGTIKENLAFGNDKIESKKLIEVLELVDLKAIYETFPKGLETELSFSGYPLWRSQIARLEIARTIVNDYDLFIFTDYFDSFSLERRKRIINYLKSKNKTVIIISTHKADEYSDVVLELNENGLENATGSRL